MERQSHSKRLVAGSALAAILAGVIHLAIIPEHWSHAPAHGLFFLSVGILQIGWGVIVWRNPSLWLYYTGVVMGGSLIVLYVLTRWLPAPFGHGPESIGAIDIICKACEAFGVITLLVLILQDLIRSSNSRIAWRAVMSIVFVALMSGFVTYGIAGAAEPIFPGLSVQEAVHHDQTSLPLEQHDHEGVLP